MINFSIEQFISELRSNFDRSQIKDSELYRALYARDASYFSILPQLIVRPQSIDQIIHLFALINKFDQHLTFRAGGTSLAGQTLGDGIICELRTDWKDFEVRNNGKQVWFEPGLTCRQLNQILNNYQTKLGPDPASSRAAMMGGVLANNSSGMQAGTRFNSYKMLRSLTFVLANGNKYDSSREEDRLRFEKVEQGLCETLMRIRGEILNNSQIKEKIERKYKIKNVTGYGMNSFLDFDNPMDIFIHLLIGSEGTLAFIASAEQNTVPLLPCYSSAMLYFSDVTRAAAAVPYLEETGAISVELMDYAALQSMVGQPKSLPVLSELPSNSTALLIDYGAKESEELNDLINQATDRIKGLSGLNQIDDFTRTVSDREKLWNIRDGIFPCVAGARSLGDAVILEDVAAPVDRLDRLVDGVSSLFRKYNYQGSIFGHARDGNIHPLLTSDMRKPDRKKDFAGFMDDLVDLVISLDGSLKGEHGTGRAVAPFVEKEWGSEIYDMMRQIKLAADPHNRLNPGVLINSDPNVHLEDLKDMTVFNGNKADSCIECGFCEHVCPSRNVTLTPRQRIQSQRVIQYSKNRYRFDYTDKLQHQYKYAGEETCAADGMCQTVCPMGINTAELTDAIREQTQGSVMRSLMHLSANHFGVVESCLKGSLKFAVSFDRKVSPKPLTVGLGMLHKLYSPVPHWSKYFPKPPILKERKADSPDFVYFPSCVTRIFGSSTHGKDDLMTVVCRLAEKASYKIYLPAEVKGLCCSQIWEHKGDPIGQAKIANNLIEHFWAWSEEGKLPIICDTTSCTHTMLKELVKEDNITILSKVNTERFHKLKIKDLTLWISEDILPVLQVRNKKKSVLLHPTCACDIMGYTPVMKSIAELCAEEVVIPLNRGCCGASGDRGFVYPELSESALKEEKAELQGKAFDGYYSLARTCEINMEEHMSLPYESIAYLVDEVSN